jgi:hypothetical protein
MKVNSILICQKYKEFIKGILIEGVPATADKQPHRLLVKQSYALKCSQKASEHFKNFNPVILKEKSRTIKNDGTVIKYMNDNSVIVNRNFHKFHYDQRYLYKKL